jgi:hypothetical protein
MIITKMALPRRTFLRGMGVMFGLPFLDAMAPALTAIAKTAAKPVRRMGFIYTPNGVIQELWTPATVGADFELSQSLIPLSPLRDQLLVLSGLAHRQAESFGDGPGDHPRATAAWLSGVHAWDRRKSDVRLATTVDQLAAAQLGKDTQVASLELALELPTQMACDAGDCFYANTISWRTPTTPNPMEAHPRVVFERLFGDGGSAAQRRAQMQKTGSILDSVNQEVHRLQTSLGPSDRSKLTEYFEAVRSVEQRIQSAEQHSAESTLALPERPIDIPDTFEAHARLMFDLQVLAYQADITRVFTMMMAREQSPRTYPHIGVSEQHHSVSHHRDDPEYIAKKAKIDKHHVQVVGSFLEKLRATPDGDGSLLDHSMILYGAGLGNPNLHEHRNLPVLVAGGLGGQLKTGRHLRYPEDTPMTNLFVTLLDKIGIATEALGDSTGKLAIDQLSDI